MSKLSIAIAIFVLLPLLLGGAGMITIIAAKFSQTPIDQSSTPSETITTPIPTADPACGDGICSKNERTNASCAIDC